MLVRGSVASVNDDYRPQSTVEWHVSSRNASEQSGLTWVNSSCCPCSRCGIPGRRSFGTLHLP